MTAQCYSIKKDGDYLRVYLLESLKLSISLKNAKLSAGIAIVNFGPALFCPGEILGLCRVCGRCYAKSREVVPSYWHPGHYDILDYRFAQYHFFRHATRAEVLSVFEHVFLWLSTHGYRRLRLQEASDFYSQWYVDTAEAIARLGRTYGIITYTYTTRKDLDYSDVRELRVNGSGWAGPTGETCVIPSTDKLPEGFKLCRKDCSKCWLCAVRGVKIAFEVHGTYSEPEHGPYVRSIPGWYPVQEAA